MNSATLTIVIDGILGLAVIAGGIVLLAVGKIDQPTGIAVIGAGVAVAKGATSAALALKVPTTQEAPQSVTPPPGA
jgi:hypothetical protein